MFTRPQQFLFNWPKTESSSWKHIFRQTWGGRGFFERKCVFVYMVFPGPQGVSVNVKELMFYFSKKKNKWTQITGLSLWFQVFRTLNSCHALLSKIKLAHDNTSVNTHQWNKNTRKWYNNSEDWIVMAVTGGMRMFHNWKMYQMFVWF